MSEPLSIGLVAEGPTDKIVIEAAIANLLGSTSFVFRQLQPEESVAFGQLGTGWPGVYRWCKQAVARAGGDFANDPLFATYSAVVIHLDADVAREEYRNGGINDPTGDLPCVRDCPPPESTTNALRTVLLRWIGARAVPGKTVFCTPSKNTDAWVVCALYSADAAVTSGDLECRENPSGLLQAKPSDERLVSGSGKIVRRYREQSRKISNAWPRVRECCTEAERFSSDFTTLVAV